MKQNNKAEFLDNMLSRVHDLPIAEVVGSVVPLTRKGRYFLGLCPFHDDHKLGSFVVTPSINLWRCFTDGIGGDGISFYRQYYNLGFLDAAFKMAVDFNIVSSDEAKMFSGKNYDIELIRKIEKKFEKPEEEKKASKGIIRSVYQAMKDVCPLSEEHRKHLLEVRGLSEEDLCDYFTFPTRRIDLPGKIIKQCKDKLSMRLTGKTYQSLTDSQKARLDNEECVKRLEEELSIVPGFYQNDKGKIDFMSVKGIGIIARDDKGYAVGIQIRRDTVKDGDSRYIWFSSSFAKYSDTFTGGASSGSPGGVVYPEKMTGKEYLCITEGRFKAEHIAKKGNIAVYVSGVSTWKSVLPEIKALRAGRKAVYLMFDADMATNQGVRNQLVALGDELEKDGLDVIIVSWDEDNGKGFDDLVLNHPNDYAKYLSYTPLEHFK